MEWILVVIVDIKMVLYRVLIQKKMVNFGTMIMGRFLLKEGCSSGRNYL